MSNFLVWMLYLTLCLGKCSRAYPIPRCKVALIKRFKKKLSFMIPGTCIKSFQEVVALLICRPQEEVDLVLIAHTWEGKYSVNSCGTGRLLLGKLKAKASYSTACQRQDYKNTLTCYYYPKWEKCITRVRSSYVASIWHYIICRVVQTWIS